MERDLLNHWFLPMQVEQEPCTLLRERVAFAAGQLCLAAIRSHFQEEKAPPSLQEKKGEGKSGTVILSGPTQTGLLQGFSVPVLQC